jgi:hypothetical protein
MQHPLGMCTILKYFGLKILTRDTGLAVDRRLQVPRRYSDLSIKLSSRCMRSSRQG